MAIIPPEFDGRIRPHAELLAPTLVRSWQNSHVPNPASATHLGWSPDGRALTYVRNTTGSTQNLYMQPLDGSPEVQLTHFDSEPAARLRPMPGLATASGWRLLERATTTPTS